MTPKPPPSSDGSSPSPRRRSNPGNLTQDTTELELWGFDDDLDSPDVTEDSMAEERPKSPGKNIPQPRERRNEKPGEAKEHSDFQVSSRAEDQIRMNVNNAHLKMQPASPAVVRPKTERDFDDLEHWEDSAAVPKNEVAEISPEIAPKTKIAAAELTESTKPEKPAEEDQEPAQEILPVSEALTEVRAGEEDEFSPVPRENAQPISLRPHLKLSKAERLGLLALGLLLAAGITFLAFSLSRLPSEVVKAQANDFPIKGSLLTVTAATSYWRAPVTEGPSAETFRRGTKLLPVIELTVSGGPAAVRVLFRNEEHAVVGDAVTRMIQSGGTLKIPATAGFDDLGMHAAYRTGESKPWTIQILESPSETAAGKEFKKIFEMNVSTDRR